MGDTPLLATPASLGQALLAVLLDPLLGAIAALALVAPEALLQGRWWSALPWLLPLLLLVPRWLKPLLLRLEQQRARQLALAEPSPQSAPESADPGAAPPAHVPWLPFGAMLLFVLMRFGGFACCVLAFDQQNALEWSGWLAGFALAWTVGLVVPGAPGWSGGVRGGAVVAPRWLAAGGATAGGGPELPRRDHGRRSAWGSDRPGRPA